MYTDPKPSVCVCMYVCMYVCIYIYIRNTNLGALVEKTASSGCKQQQNLLNQETNPSFSPAFRRSACLRTGLGLRTWGSGP